MIGCNKPFILISGLLYRAIVLSRVLLTLGGAMNEKILGVSVTYLTIELRTGSDKGNPTV